MKALLFMIALLPPPGNLRPPLLPGGHVLVFSSSFHLPTQGSAVVMRNLLSCFDPASYTVVTYGPSPEHLDSRLQGVRILHLHSGRRLRYRGGLLWCRLRQPWLDRWAVRVTKRLAPSLIMGVYPDMHMLRAAQAAAKGARIPFLAYFHDLLEEVYADTSQANAAYRLQSSVFQESASVLVIGQGMADHYRATTGFAARCLEHISPVWTEQKLESHTSLKTIFVGGTVYDVNHVAIQRLLDASRKVRLELILATGVGKIYLKRMGLAGEGLTVVTFAQPDAYRETLRHQGILAVGLNWPQESSTPEVELATAFPTKVIEYLFAGRPILVHCPGHYFLARFFRQHGCGLVVSERSSTALAEAAQGLLGDPDIQAQICANALKVARIFSAERITGIFQEEVFLASKLTWGERISRPYEQDNPLQLRSSREGSVP